MGKLYVIGVYTEMIQMDFLMWLYLLYGLSDSRRDRKTTVYSPVPD